MEQDTIIVATDSVSSSVQSGSVNIWMIIAFIELAIIAFMVLSRFTSNNKKSEIKKKVLEEGEVDFGNIVNSSFNAERLYKLLIVKCHPDRFAPDEEKMSIADDLSARLSKNKHDMNKLNEIKNEAIEKLNVKF
jgi:hypothetical protein